jgi:ribonuclease HI
MRLRNAEVLARCDASGELVSKEGRVEVRYKPNDGRAYFASASNLKAPAGAPKVEPDSFCGSGEAVKKPSKSKKKSATASAPALQRSPASAPPERPEGDEILAYADGACSGNPGPAGVGAIALWADQTRELSEYIGEATNNIAELMGVLRAVELAQELGRPLRLYTDSKYSIGVLTQGWKAKANKELVAKVRQALAAHPDTKLFHVRGHQGVRLNEYADELAVRAVQSRESTGWVGS